MSGVGFLLAASSAVLNGSFASFSKLPSVKQAGVDPLVFQMWTSFGVFLSSLLTMPFIDGDLYPVEAIGWGILAGGLFVCAVAFSFVAVQLVGLSIGQGIWSGGAIVCSFVWGVAAFGDEVHPGLAAGGLILIVAGVCGIAGCENIAVRLLGEQPHQLTSEKLDMDSSLLRTSHTHDMLAAGILTPARRNGSVDLDVDPSMLVHPAARAQKKSGLSQTTTTVVMMDGELDSSRSPDGSMAAAAAAAAVGASRPSSYQPYHAQYNHQQQHAMSAAGLDNSLSVSEDTAEWSRTSLYGKAGGSGGGSGGGGRSSLDTSRAARKSIGEIDEQDFYIDDAEHEDDAREAAALSHQRQVYGVVCALIVGVFGGSILMPLQLAPKQYRGLEFVPSFGLGTLVVAPLITLPYMWLSRSSGSRGNWAVRESLLPGLLAGTIWNGANVCSIYAIPKVGYAVAQPLMQCAILVAAIWGILVFKEIKGKAVGVIAAAGVVVLAGAVMLALSKS